MSKTTTKNAKAKATTQLLTDEDTFQFVELDDGTWTVQLNAKVPGTTRIYHLKQRFAERWQAATVRKNIAANAKEVNLANWELVEERTYQVEQADFDPASIAF